MYKANQVYENYLTIPRENRYIMLRDTAEQWASKNGKVFTETAFTPINELDSGFQYYLNNVKPEQYYESVHIAMREYYGDKTSSGPNFFENL